jgi:hypothetical protein
MATRQEKRRNVVTIVTVDPDTTIDEFIDYLIRHLHGLDEFPFDIQINEQNPKKKKIFENALQCFYLISKYASTDVSSLYPSQVQQASNLENTTNISWDDLPYYVKYVNPSLRIISDTEFLLIYFSKLLESFDTNAGALLPSYPKTILNQILHPNDIKEICSMTMLEWQIKGKRGNQVPLSRTQAIDAFQRSFPTLYFLVFEKDGFEVLTAVYTMLKIIEKDEGQSLPTRKQCVSLYEKLLKKISHRRLREFLKKYNRVGLFFLGMPHPKFQPLCILSMYLLFYFYYFPKENVYSLDENALEYIQRVKNLYVRQHPTNIFQYDLDVHNKMLKKELVSDYMLKTHVDSINKYFGRHNYTNFFDTLLEMILCNTNSKVLKSRK